MSVAAIVMTGVVAGTALGRSWRNPAARLESTALGSDFERPVEDHLVITFV